MLTEQQIKVITEEVINKVGLGSAVPPLEEWLCDTADEAVKKAKAAQEIFGGMSLEQRGKIIDAMRYAAKANAEALSRLAIEETGYGRLEHKIAKHYLMADKTPGVEDLNTVAQTGDKGLVLTEPAPFGVICSITPSTNPTTTVVNNSISMLSAGNAVVFCPHPLAKRASQAAIRVMYEAARSEGAPACIITTVRQPSIEASGAVMEHPDVSMLSVTGGEAVVHSAMRAGKKAVCAGPGNPPVIVDETANIGKTARDIVNGASFDNNILCIAEKEVFAVSSIADKLISEMLKNDCVLLSAADTDKVLKTVLRPAENGKYVINRQYVGKNAAIILRDSGVAVTGDPKLAIAKVPMGHPFVMTEMMMPVLSVVAVRDIDEAIEFAFQAEQGFHHSAMIHSANVHNMSKAARKMNTTIFVKNAPSYSGVGFGGEGHTTMTIATPTGEGITSARTFTRARRCVLYGDFRIV